MSHQLNEYWKRWGSAHWLTVMLRTVRTAFGENPMAPVRYYSGKRNQETKEGTKEQIKDKKEELKV